MSDGFQLRREAHPRYSSCGTRNRSKRRTKPFSTLSASSCRRRRSQPRPPLPMQSGTARPAGSRCSREEQQRGCSRMEGGVALEASWSPRTRTLVGGRTPPLLASPLAAKIGPAMDTNRRQALKAQRPRMCRAVVAGGSRAAERVGAPNAFVQSEGLQREGAHVG